MNILLPVAAAAVLFVIALRVYPRWIARNFQEDDANVPPSVKFADGRDYVKSRTHVVFAHHFTAIAGAGPIVGPTLALAFGWKPVWLWVVLGGIFFGAVHDMCAMFVSLREDGRTIGEIARRTLGTAGYLLNLLVLIFVISVVNAIFLTLAVTALTSTYPLARMALEPGQNLLNTVMVNGVEHARIGGIATTSALLITLVAPFLGLAIHRNKIKIRYAYVIATVVCVGSVILGFFFPIVVSVTHHTATVAGLTVALNEWFWIALGLCIYLFFASAIPVWALLQPRDFISVQIQYVGMLLLVVGVFVCGFKGAELIAPGMDLATGSTAQGPLWPILFITVACGAISGFHSLVASGTTVKQLPNESSIRRVAYGGMILESFLAVLVVMAVGSMIAHSEYMSIVYPTEAGVRANPGLAFAVASGRLIHGGLPFIPVAIGIVFGIILLEGFVVDTLDASVRLCRLLLEEFWQFCFDGQAPAFMRHPYFNTCLALGFMLVFALSSTLTGLWGVFGAGNQLIGALALTTCSVWLVQRAKKSMFAIIPAIFMVCTTLAALYIMIRKNFYGPNPNHLLAWTSFVLLFLAAGVVIVGSARLFAAIQANSRPQLEPAVGGK